MVSSSEYVLSSSLFQGTVFGLVLWNTFFEDSSEATSAAGFMDITYADDLNAFKRFPVTTNNATLLDDCRRCRDNLHAWGAANQVQWEHTKESSHVVALRDAWGDPSRSSTAGYKWTSWSKIWLRRADENLAKYYVRNVSIR